MALALTSPPLTLNLVASYMVCSACENAVIQYTYDMCVFLVCIVLMHTKMSLVITKYPWWEIESPKNIQIIYFRKE